MRVDPEDISHASNRDHRWWCIHPDFKTHGQSQLKSETESTNGHHCHRKNYKKNGFTLFQLQDGIKDNVYSKVIPSFNNHIIGKFQNCPAQLVNFTVFNYECVLFAHVEKISRSWDLSQ